MDRDRELELTAEAAAACDEGSGLMYELEPLLAAYYRFAAERGGACHDVREAIGLLNGQDPFVAVRERAYRVQRGDMSWSAEFGGRRASAAGIEDLEYHGALNQACRLVDYAREDGWEQAGELADVVGQADAARDRAAAALGEIDGALSS